MALNFPDAPNADDTYTEGSVTWVYDGTVWNIQAGAASSDQNLFATVNADSGTVTASNTTDALTVAGGTNVTTAIVGKTLTINSSAVGGSSDVIKTVTTDDGSFTASGEATLQILGRTNISTELTTNTNELHIDLDPHSIDFLSDVDTTTSAPAVGQVLKWDGTQWAPGFDSTTGGGGTDADTFDGFDSTYFLNYNNLTNTPTVATLSDFSVGNERTPDGDGAIEYDNTTGVFRYTPPTPGGIGALSAEVNDLTAAVVWDNVPDANITQSSVTQHQAALSVTESQITDLGSYITDYTVVASDLNALSVGALSDVDLTGVGNGEVLAWNTTNSRFEPTSPAGSGGIALTDLSVTANAASGTGALVYDDTTGTFTYTPPAAGAVDIDDLSDVSITWIGNLPLDNKGQLLSWTGSTFINYTGTTIDKITENTLVEFQVGNVGTQSYNFFPHYTGQNPTIYVLSGTTVSFKLDGAQGHPFAIQDPTGTTITDATQIFHVQTNGNKTTGSLAQGRSEGVLYWRIPESYSGGYRYQCTAHPAMVGSIQVKRFSLI